MFSLIRSIYKRDPSLYSKWHVLEILFYPGLHAILIHRMAHFLYNRSIPVVPRFMSCIARFMTGIDIHPGADIGKNCFIDHGTGVVIGETCKIGKNVLIFQSVTLGARKVGCSKKKTKRHPIVGDNVILCTGCKVLGPVTIGNNTIVGANVVVVNDVPPNVKVIQKSICLIKERIGSTPVHKLDEFEDSSMHSTLPW